MTVTYVMCIPWAKKKKKKRLIEDECAICLGAILKKYSKCPNCSVCVHRACLLRWKYQCYNKKLDYTCPICRYVYKEFVV